MRARGLLVLLFAAAFALPAAARAQDIDTQQSRVEFDLRTRWGPLLKGHFPRFEGRVDTLPDGRRQVRMRLSSAHVEVAGPARYTTMARGERLFDAARHPWIEFVSEPYDAGLARTGGALPGRLRLRGVERTEQFVLRAASCERPGHACAVTAEGRVSRDDYGLTGWHWALADRVRFRLHVRYAD